MVNFECVMIVGILISFGGEEIANIDCGDDIDVIVGVVGVRGVHIVDSAMTVKSGKLSIRVLFLNGVDLTDLAEV